MILRAIAATVLAAAMLTLLASVLIGLPSLVVYSAWQHSTPQGVLWSVLWSAWLMLLFCGGNPCDI